MIEAGNINIKWLYKVDILLHASDELGLKVFIVNGPTTEKVEHHVLYNIYSL